MIKDPLISIEEVEKHSTRDDCWTIIHGKVYDVTDFLPKHPGGATMLVKFAGKDSTLQFDDIGHSMESLEYDLGPQALKGKLYNPVGTEKEDPVVPSFLNSNNLPLCLQWLINVYRSIRGFLLVERDTKVWFFTIVICLCVLTLGLLHWSNKTCKIIDNTDYGVPSWLG